MPETTPDPRPPEPGGATEDPAVRSFRVSVSGQELADLRRRIAATRWPSAELVADRSQGVQLATIRELPRYWVTEYDWRRCEAGLDTLPQFTTEIDGSATPATSPRVAT